MTTDEINMEESPALFEDISPDKDRKILKLLKKEGEGEEYPFSGCKVFVHYVGRLEDGKVFDSSHDRGEIFTFNVGTNSVIQGWDIGILTMKKNEICELKIAPEYGYGAEGFPPKIPENSILLFEVELLGWEDENITEDKGVRKHIIKEGDGISKPKLDSKVKAHIRCTYKGTVFDERDVEFFVGEGYECNIVEGIEKAICKMKRFERAKVFVKSKYAYGDKGCEKYNIPPNAEEIEYEIVLYSFERPKEVYEMNYQEKIERSELLKVKALKCLQANKHKKAIEFYDRIITYVQINEEDSDYESGLPYKIAANSNASLCYLKLKDFFNAKLRCEKVIKVDPNHIKAHFRLGEAYLGLNEFANATQSYKTVLELDPNNKVARSQLILAKKKEKEQIDKEKKLYGAMLLNLNPN